LKLRNTLTVDIKRTLAQQLCSYKVQLDALRSKAHALARGMLLTHLLQVSYLPLQRSVRLNDSVKDLICWCMMYPLRLSI
jgi:hypothetical protein